MKNQIIDQKEKNTYRNDYSKEMDPFNHYGYGVTVYFSFLRNMIFTFTALSILTFPLLYIYHAGTGYDY